MFQNGIRSGAAPNASWFSDSTLKIDVKPINSSLEKLLLLQSYEYYYNIDSIDISDDEKYFGFLAQEVENVFPNLVVEEDGFKKIRYIQLIAILVSSVQEQQREIDLLKETIHQQNELIKKQQMLIDNMINSKNE